MKDFIERYFSEFEFNNIVAPTNVKEVMGVPLPTDYLEFMKKYNGGEGSLGNGAWLRLNNLDELEELTLGYEIQQVLPEHCLIGTDGGGTLIGVDKLGNYFIIDCISIDPNDKVIIGNSFEEFIKKIHIALYGE